MKDRSTIWVCLACGKRSHDLYGDNPIDPMWDASCMLNAVECYEDKLVINCNRVVKIWDDGIVPKKEEKPEIKITAAGDMLESAKTILPKTELYKGWDKNG